MRAGEDALDWRWIGGPDPSGRFFATGPPWILARLLHDLLSIWIYLSITTLEVS